MTAFDRAWSIAKGRGNLTTLLDRMLPEESKKSIMRMNLSTAQANMDYDEDPSVNFPRECTNCPSLHTIHNWLEGTPTSDGGGICSVCLDPSLQQRIDDAMEMEGMFGDGKPFDMDQAIQDGQLVGPNKTYGVDYGAYEDKMRDME